jgi:hypothetical protein
MFRIKDQRSEDKELNIVEPYAHILWEQHGSPLEQGVKLTDKYHEKIGTQK